MQGATAKKILDALKKSDIDTYQFSTDLGTHFYNNNENSILLYDENNECFINIRKQFTIDTSQYKGKILAQCANVEDIHECRVGGDYKQIKKFVENYGLKLNDDQVKILLNIDRKNYDIIPETGDYQVSEDSAEELEKQLKNKGLLQGSAVQVTV